MKLIFLAQIHKPPSGTANFETYKQIIRSQFAIAKYLLEHPTTPVVDEGLIAYENYKKDEFKTLFVDAFPSGIPDKLEDLNPNQEDFFYRQGGTMIVYQLGYIKKAYGSTHTSILKIQKEAAAEYIKDSGSFGEYHEEIMYEREKEAISCIQEIIFEEDPDEVILVYGGGHDFLFYCEKFGYEYERIDTDPQFFTSPLILIKREFGEILRRLYDEPEPTFITSQLINWYIEKRIESLEKFYEETSQPNEAPPSDEGNESYKMPKFGLH